MSEEPIRIFVSYAYLDRVWCRHLLPVLKVKANVSNVQTWHDADLRVGDLWDAEIRSALANMHVFLCLVSMNYLASDYIRKVELPVAEARYRTGEVIVVPILLERVNLQEDCAFLHTFQALPSPRQPWQHLRRRGLGGDALFAIGEGLKLAIRIAEAKRVAR